MGTQYAGANSYPIDFPIPDDGDAETAASVGVALEALGDRTAWNKALAPDRLPLTNFRASVSGAFVHGVWNAVQRSWYAIETTTICRQSTTAGWSWSNNVITGADVLKKIACDAAGNMVIIAGANGGIWQEFNASTSVWTRYTGSMGSGISALDGEFSLMHDDVNGKWFLVARDSGNWVKSYTSTDRVTWSAGAPCGTATNDFRTVQAAVSSTGRIVLMARNAPAGTLDGTQAVLTSDDGGGTWTARAGFTHAMTTGTADSLKWNAASGEFMAVIGDSAGPSCKVFTSPDGVTWTARAASTTKCIRRVSSIGKNWVGVLTTGDVVFSTDHGATWNWAGFAVDTGATALISSGAQLLSMHTATVWPGFVSGVGGIAAL